MASTETLVDNLRDNSPSILLRAGFVVLKAGNN